MNSEELNKLSDAQKKDLASDYRKTVHKGEIVFSNDRNEKSLTTSEAKEVLLRQRDKILASLKYGSSKESENKTLDEDYSRRGK